MTLFSDSKPANNQTDVSSSQPAVRGRTRVAVLGGGLGALTSVYELLAPPGAKDRYEITVYAMGHRLGGKCASGRDAHVANRVLEHGLHVWFGCYHQGFRFIRDVFEELPENVALERDWTRVFCPHRSVELWDRQADQWSAWRLEFPDNSLSPGRSTPLDDLPSLVRALLKWIATFFEMALVPEEQRTTLRSSVQALVGNVIRGGVTGMMKLLTIGVERLIHGRPAPWIRRIRQRLSTAWQRSNPDEGTRRFWIMADLALTVLAGIAQDRVLTRGIDPLENQDFRAWLAKHGASTLTLEAAPIRVVYDMMFAYEEGDRRRPNASAGTMMLSILRMLFAYAGSFSYKMATGMGDAVLAPLYEVLLRKGVRFRFFHRVELLTPTEDGRDLGRITLVRQATLRSEPYRPFIEVHGRLCWPETPRYEQLVEGEELQRVNLERPSDPWPGVERICLEAGRDFEEVILGIPVGGLQRIAGPLAAQRPEWRAMLKGLGTVATVSAQLWMNRSGDALRPGVGRRAPLTGGHAGTFDTWAEMSHLAPVENWPQAPASIHYGCAPFPESQTSAPLGSLLTDYLEEHGPTLWPGTGRRFDDGVLIDLKEGTGSERVDAQYLRLNHEGSDRYVQSLVGTSALRLPPDRSGFGNLWLAGDWTRTQFNLGSVESTVRSAMACAAGLRAKVGA